MIRDSQSVDNSKSKNLIPNRSNSNIQNKSINKSDNKSDNKSINKSKSLNKSKDSISLDPFRITSGNNFEIKNAYMRKKSEKEKEEEIDFEKVLNREDMVSENFNKFFNSQKGQEMILKMDEPQNKICITLHKYFVSLITRRKFKKNIKYYKHRENTTTKKSNR